MASAEPAPALTTQQPVFFVGNPEIIAEAVRQAFDDTNSTPSIPFCGKAVNPDTGELCEYLELVKSSDGHFWERSCCAEFG
jgi:hypothetical protein